MEMAHMTSQQVEYVQRDWAKLAPDATAAKTVAQLILFTMYRQNPETKRLFSFLKEDHTEDEMANLARFKTHVSSLSKYLVLAIQGLNDQQETSRVFREIGSSHIKRKVKREHASALVDAIVTVLKSALGSETDLSHWVAFSKFITSDFADVLDGKVKVIIDQNSNVQ